MGQHTDEARSVGTFGEKAMTEFNKSTLPKSVVPFGYVWRKDYHGPKFYFVEADALNTQKLFGGEVIKVYTHD